MFRKFINTPRRFFGLSAAILAVSAVVCAAISVAAIPGHICVVAGAEAFSGLPAFVSIKESEGSAVVAVAATGDTPVTENIVKDGSAAGQTDMYTAEVAISLFGVNVKNVSVDVIPDTDIVPCGMTVGINIDAIGPLVLGTGAVVSTGGSSSRPCDGILKTGDIILKADNKDMTNHKQFTSYIESLPPGGKVELTVLRGGQTLTVQVTCAVSAETNKNMLGLWIRDSTKGIGTVTYYNPDNSRFAALGHGVVDVDTRQLIPVRDGRLLSANIVAIKKGKRGSPGELVGEIDKYNALGVITSNTAVGLFGSINKGNAKLPGRTMKITLQGDVHEGPAQILSNIDGYEVKPYDIYIERLNLYSADEAKGMVIRITDQELITRTNGIVQGMSGCPIIQDGRVVGAVTHVFVQNPLKGYGIFIENMIRQEKKL